MHEYLDEEIPEEHKQELKEHLQICADCKQHFNELVKTVALVQSTSHIQTPENFTEKVMMHLPREKKKVGIKRWFGRHPILTAAAVFIIFMTASVFASWNQDDNFSVTKNKNIIIENNTTAVVPEGKTVEGDIVVKNGDIRIEGKVDGNVTIINGNNYLASAGTVTGEIEEINKVFDWLWHKIKDISSEVLQLFNSDKDAK
ncbi:anti-sigma factor [Caldibacillus lycopersici]|uniref:Anti-sigma-W factor RsiW n=2 Tax=Perspicuibacillus lycopersici TaxID=1325689 RepID=A0AAE3IWQ1_9BACI|nr:anti-sigma factor [Perspicuibacillus lycopersici]